MQGASATEILTGTPGRSINAGGVGYYENATDTTLTNGYKDVTVGPSVGPSDTIFRRNYENTPDEKYTYYGKVLRNG